MRYHPAMDSKAMAARRWAGTTPAERTAAAKKAARARWGEPRKKSVKSKVKKKGS